MMSPTFGPLNAARTARAALVDRVDSFVLGRMRTLVDRAGRGVGRSVDEVNEVVQDLRPDMPIPPTDPAGVARALDALWDRERGPMDPSPELQRAVIEQFHRLYYHSDTTWHQTTYRGVTTWKCPLDLWIYQEILHEIRPALVVETGTAYGGSALFLADACESLGTGEVVTIDVAERAVSVNHPRLRKIVGSSVDGGIRDLVAGMAAQGPVVVILDSDHTADHVLAELRLWCDLVTPGSYLIVEDTNINGHPVYPDFGPGPAEAVAAFLQEHDEFSADTTRHKFLMTWNAGGYLRRQSR
jgi:cephalosporin hydroxylase